MTRIPILLALTGSLAVAAPETITGLLMDASCAAITSTQSQPVTGTTKGTVKQDGMTGANAQSTQGSIARTRTEVESAQSRASEERFTDRTEKDAANNPGTNTRGIQSSRTVSPATSTATAGPSQASATGTTGAATNTAPPQSGNLQSTDRVQGPGASNPEHSGDRARTEPSVTVREKYRECIVKPDTKAFAIHTDGRVYVLDQASNAMVHEQMRNEAFSAAMSDRRGAPRFMTVTVLGTPSGDTLSITSVRK